MNHSSEPTLSANVHAWGATSATLAEIAALRKAIPPWAPSDTPGHFLKYADGQAVVAINAVDRAIRHQSWTGGEQSAWGVVAAPKFVGRLSGAEIFRRFAERGDQGVSPHTLPQHSLHSISGAISILLGTHGPNVGVGGGPEALSEGLFTALTMFDVEQTPGVWLVCSEWDPEPLPDEAGQCTTDAVCHAVALGLRPINCEGTLGRVTLQINASVPQASDYGDVSVAKLAEIVGGQRTQASPRLGWTLPWGDRIELELSAAPAAVPAAA